MSYKMDSHKVKQEITLFVEEAESVLEQITKSLNWNPDDSQVTIQTKFTQCPINHEHRVPANKMDQHVKKCRLKSLGYSLDDDFLEPLDPDLLDHPSVVQMDKYKQRDILAQALKRNRNLKISTRLRDPPLTFDRYLYEFTPDERYVLYDYAIQQTSSQQEEHRKFTTDTLALGSNALGGNVSKGPKPSTLKDLLLAERDAKRRRQAYRKKNPDQSGRKSDTETLRELIQSQMEFHFDNKTDGAANVDSGQDNKVQWRIGRRHIIHNNHRRWEILEQGTADDGANSHERRPSIEYPKEKNQHRHDRRDHRDRPEHTKYHQRLDSHKHTNRRTHSRSPPHNHSSYGRKHRRSRSRSIGKHKSSHRDSGRRDEKNHKRHRQDEKYSRARDGDRGKSRSQGQRDSSHEGKGYEESKRDYRSSNQSKYPESRGSERHKKDRNRSPPSSVSRHREIKPDPDHQTNFNVNTDHRTSEIHTDRYIKQEPVDIKLEEGEYLDLRRKLLPPSPQNETSSSESSVESRHEKKKSKSKKSKKDKRRPR